MIFLSFYGCIQNSTTTKSLSPEYNLEASEIPIGFKYSKINDESRSIGVTDNPGALNDEFIINIYKDVDIDQILATKMHVFIEETNPSKELGLIVIQYVSSSSLLNEIKKLKKYSDRVYLISDDALFILWSDANIYETEITNLKNRLIHRLGLNEYK